MSLVALLLAASWHAAHSIGPVRLVVKHAVKQPASRNHRRAAINSCRANVANLWVEHRHVPRSVSRLDVMTMAAHAFGLQPKYGVVGRRHL